MKGPIAAMTALHNACRRDMEGVDAAALGAARGEPGLEAAFDALNDAVAAGDALATARAAAARRLGRRHRGALLRRDASPAGRSSRCARS